MKIGDLVYSPTTENYIGIVTAIGEWDEIRPNNDGTSSETVQVMWNDRQQTLHLTCFLEILNEAR